jgi:hypothetical protein
MKMKVKREREKNKKKIHHFRQEKSHAAGNRRPKISHHEKKQMPISWRQSEAINHMYGENSLQIKEKTTGLYDRQNEKSSKTSMKEVFRAENSYGNIAVGANKKKEATVVVSQKREHNGKNTEEYQKNLHMERKRRKVSPVGDILTNNSQFKDSAWAYKGKTTLPVHKVFSEIKKHSQKEESRMLEKRMPFLSLERDKKQMQHLAGRIRASREKGDVADAYFLEKQKEALDQSMKEKEENERRLRKKIKFAWKKAEKVTGDDFERIRRSGNKKNETEEAEITETPENNSDNPSKKMRNDGNGYKNVENHTV